MATLAKATVMLATLVGIPALWIYLGPLPPAAQQVVDRLIERARSSFSLAATTRTPTMGEDRPHQGAGEDQAPSRLSAQCATAATIGSDLAGAAGAANPPVADAQKLPFEPQLAALRQMGAVEYRLVRWGASGKFYRFCCSMALGSGNEHVQQFESIARTPEECISQVVDLATRWQTDRLANRSPSSQGLANPAKEGPSGEGPAVASRSPRDAGSEARIAVR